MFCFLHKWLISSTMDTGDSLPGFVRRHLTHCRKCKSFAVSVMTLHERLGPEAVKIQAHSPANLNDKIIDALPGRIPSSRSMGIPGDRTGNFDVWLNKGKIRWKPLLSMGMALVVLVVGVLWLSGPGKTFDPKNEFGIEFPIPSENGNALYKLAKNLESPLQKELNILKSAMVSAKDYLVDQSVGALKKQQIQE